MSNFIGSSKISIPDRRILMRPALEKDQIVVVSDDSNQDAGGPRGTMLRPGNVLLKHSSDGKYYDDTTNGAVSTQASVSSAAAAGANWASKTVEVQIDGVSIVTVALGVGDDTTAEVVAALNANATFRAHCIASGTDGNPVTVKTLRVGADVHLKVIGNHADVFGGATGTEARGTDGEWVVTTEYCDQLDPLGNVKDARVHAVRSGIFKESNLVFGGASALPQDLKRVMLERGARFE